ncbi:hypothetical protein [Terrabacter sp. BE26]|uniref:hypothetical protein n=1 Tax=Terrabacter sp. BE26 TaxID=2898152 RepID=UPI0035BE9422
MTSSEPTDARGRLVLVTAARGEDRAALGSAVAERLGRAVLVDGAALEAAVITGPVAGWDEPPTTQQLRLRMLRWSAALAVAETYQLEGFDVVVAEEALGDRLEDFLDLVEPEPVHVVVVRDEGDATTPPWGLSVPAPWRDDADLAAVAGEVLEHLAEAVVETATSD